MSNLSLENPLFTTYAFYAGLLAVKVLLMAPFTAYFRVKNKVFLNEEDAKYMGAKGAKFDDRDVERVRRIHQNDLENIPLFCIVGLLYLLTDPTPLVAKTCFRIYAMSRVIHTILYLCGTFKRGYAFLLGLFINIFMGINVVLTCL